MEKHLKKPTKCQIANIITVCIVFAVMMFLNIKCPYISDDFHFKFIWKDFHVTDNDEPVRNFGDIIESVKNYYLLSGGRVLPHLAAYFFLYIDKIYFNIVNSLVFVYIGCVIYYMTLRSKTNNILGLPFIFLLLFYFIPYFGDDIIWLSGAASYHWTSAVFLTVICLFTDIYDKNISKHRDLKYAALLLLTYVSSSSNEMTGGMLILFFIMYWLIKKKKVVKDFIFLNISAIFGTIIMLTAPGNYNRAANSTEIKFFDNFFSVLGEYLKWIITYAGSFLLLYILYIIFYAFVKHTKFEIRDLLDKFLMTIVGFAGITVLSFIGICADRPTIFGMMLLIANFCKIIPELYNMIVIDIPEFLKSGFMRKIFLNFHKWVIVLFVFFCLSLANNIYLYNKGINMLTKQYETVLNGGGAFDIYDSQIYGNFYPATAGSLGVFMGYTRYWYEKALEYGIETE